MAERDRPEVERTAATHHRTWPELPGGALVFLYLAVVLAPLGLAAFTGIPPEGAFAEAATGLGAIALAAMIVQFLSSGRFETFAGRVGIDVTMAFHKWAARWVLLAVVLHPLLYVAPTMLADPARGFARLTGMASASRLSTGTIAWVALVLLVVLAFTRDRLPVTYEAWRGAHGVLALVAVAGGLHHALTAGTYAAEPGPRMFWFAAVLVVVLAVAILYGWRWWKLHRYPWVLTSVRPVGKAMWQLDLEPAPGTPPLAYRAGQFVWMSVAPRLFPLFDHPFSLASAPGRPGIALVIKELGDFTRTVGSIPAGKQIGIDGPHGDFTAEGRRAGALLLVAGGVGIAPILGILRDLVERRDPRPVRLVYGAGSPEKLIARDEIAAATDVIDLKPILVVEEGGEAWAGMLGAIDRPALEAALSDLDRSDTLALICGPDLMMSAVADNLLRLGLREHNVVYERFVYGETPPSRRDRRRQAYFAAIGLALALAVLAFAWR